MTDPRHGAGNTGPGEESPGPESFPGRRESGRGRGPRRPIAFPGRSAKKAQPAGGGEAPPDTAPDRPWNAGSAAAGSAPAGSAFPASASEGHPSVVPASPGASAEIAGGSASGGCASAEPTSAGSLSAGSLFAGSLSAGSSDEEESPAGPLSPSSPLGVEPPPEIAAVADRVFGDRFGLAVDFARLLVTDGVVRGLIGPREAPRIWERHLVNCAVVSDLIPNGASVVDVGSGAGLPGIVLAVARPDLHITLVEPLARRTAFLSEAVTSLGLEKTVTVLRGRAEDVVDGPPAGADVVTARAVAPLDRLAGWCLPLARLDGRLLALKGASAAEEAAEHRAAVAALGGSEPVIRLCGENLIDPPTTVIEVVVRSRPTPPTRAAGPGREAGGRAGSRGSGRGRSRRG